MGKRLFDLNIEEVLENWELHHVIREIIANALDEQVLSRTAAPEIVKERDGWHVRDLGRGIRIEHFTQNENPDYDSDRLAEDLTVLLHRQVRS